MSARSTTGTAVDDTDDPEKDMAKKKGTPGRKDRSPSGPTRPTTFRIAPSGMTSILRLSQRLDLRSQAGAIELGVHQLLAMMEKCDARPPLDPEQLELVAKAIEAAGVVPRTLGATANFQVVLIAAVTAAETILVPNECSAKEYAALVEAVKGFDAPQALWAIGQVLGG